MDDAARLRRYFEQYNPAKIATIPAVLERFRGNEAEMWSMLTAKYGPEHGRAPQPAAAASPTEQRLARFYAKYCPEKAATAAAAAAKYHGREDVLFAQLTAKYGPEPVMPVTAVPGEARLRRFFAKYEPQQAAGVPALLHKYAGREQQLFTLLTRQYGPEPPSPEARLTRFFQKHNPAKIPTIPTILAAYAGSEADMFKALVAKYGPEPPPPQRSCDDVGASDCLMQ
jgi:hypothetical protein